MSAAHPGYRFLLAGLAIAALSGPAAAQAAAAPDAGADRLELLQQQLAEQARALVELRRALVAQEAGFERLRGQVEAELRSAAPARGQPAGAATQAASATSGSQAAAAGKPEAAPPQIAAIFEQPGVLTPAGQLTLEPSLQYAYATSTRVALVGYTVIPAVVVGLIDVREVNRSTFAAALTGRYDISPRLEVEAKIPYVYRSDTSIGRPVSEGADTSSAFGASGRAIGDIEFSARYQLNTPSAEGPFYVGSLRVKTRTGRDPFEVRSSTTVQDFSGEGVQTELPTGSGFYSLQPALTVLIPSDPAVFFGSLSYLHNFARRHVDLNTDQGSQPLGKVSAGGIFGFNFGMGLALNDRSSFSIGYDHSSVGRTRVNGAVASDSVRVQLGTLLLGYSFRLDAKRTVNLSLGAGLTRDTPDVTLTLRLPYTF